MKAKIVLAAIVAMMVVAVMAMPATAVGANVPTSAQINGVNTPPVIQYVWELPDDDLNTNGTQVEPTPGGITEVYKYIVVYHPVSADLIDNVKETTYYPNSATVHSWSWAVKLNKSVPADMAEIEQAKKDAVNASFITQAEADAIDYLISCNLAAMYKEINYMDNCDPPGEYKVEVIACTTGGTYSNLHTSYFDYLSGIGFLIDFNAVDYGLIVPDVYKEVCGDLDMTTTNKPTIENICNDPFELCVNGTDMVNTNDSARIIPVGCLDVKLGGDTIFPLTGNMQCFPIWIAPCPNSVQCMSFSINAPLGTCGGIYEGTIMLEIRH